MNSINDDLVEVPDIGTDPTVWLDSAAEYVTLVGDKVSSWNDRQNSNDFVQGTDGNRPVWSADGVTFTAASDHFLSLASVTLNQPCTYFFVAENWGASGGAVFGGSGTSNRNTVWMDGAIALKVYAGATLTPGLTGDSGVNVWAVLFNGASSAAWKNGTQGATIGNAGTHNVGGLRLGSYFNGTSDLQATIKEFIAYAGDQSAHVATVTAALQAKHA